MSDPLDRLKSALSDRYVIEREIGSGGMATVYLAHDVKHDREVAVKVLRPELAVAIGADRFLREIRITANLNHAHILPLLDSGEADDVLFYVMPYVKGESLRDRLNRETQLSVDEALRLASEVADALGSAHRQGLIHRDIKPENILLREGHAVMADFGIALAIKAAQGDRLTETGLSLGTPSYMSPEQIEGIAVDGRSDIYELGCVLFEILTGRPPFDGPTPLAVVVKHQTEPPPDPRELDESIPPDVSELILKCIAKDREDRYQTATELLGELDRIRHAVMADTSAFSMSALLKQLRRPIVMAPTAFAIVALVWLGVWFNERRSEVRWARDVAIPEVGRLIGENDVWRNLVPPYRLAERAEAVLGTTPELEELFRQCAREIDILTEPPGANVFYKEYVDPDAEWSLLGVTPLEAIRVPIGIFRWKIEKDGYETVGAAASTWNMGGAEELIVGYDIFRTLDAEGNLRPGTVRVPATETEVGFLGEFFIGRYEVTNREFREFVDAGGYRNRDYWKHTFVKDGRQLTWDEVGREFVDQTGQPGPSTWLAGDFPQGQGEHPVSGVSWYEAAAFAEYAEMSLPTATHWNVARGAFTPIIQWPQLGGFGILAPFTNFGGQGSVAVGSLRGITAYGAYDMPGNVREWCWNEASQGRVVRGGSWEDNSYEFEYERQAPPMNRSARNGFRLAHYPDAETVPDAAFAFRDPQFVFDVRAQPPAPDAVFRVYKEQFSYDRTDLNAEVEHSLESPGGWIHETISFDAAYDDERVLGHLFLPANTPPPYQTVIYFPGSASTWMPSSEGLESYYEFTMFTSYLVRNGRAVLYPVYKGTFERGGPEFIALTQPENTGSYAYTEYLVQVVKDLRRSIDYLETREDIDNERLAYYGMSWGANMGAIIPAVEERFGVSVLVGGGLLGLGRPEASDLTYVTRVRTPTLMLNGQYDVFFPPETSSQPMFDLLATPPEDKRLILYETDHIPPRNEYIKETLAWLDKYLGPVGR